MKCPESLCLGESNSDITYHRYDESNPGYFVQCSNGISHCFECPANLVFDEKIRACTYAKKSGI